MPSKTNPEPEPTCSRHEEPNPTEPGWCSGAQGMAAFRRRPHSMIYKWRLFSGMCVCVFDILPSDRCEMHFGVFCEKRGKSWRDELWFFGFVTVGVKIV